MMWFALKTAYSRKRRKSNMVSEEECVPLFLVYDNDTRRIYEDCFHLEAAEYYAKQRGNCSVGCVMIPISELEELE